MKKIVLLFTVFTVLAYGSLNNGEYIRYALPEAAADLRGYVILGSGAAASGLSLMADDAVREWMQRRQYLPPVVDRIADKYVGHYWAFGASALGAVCKGYQTGDYRKPVRYWAMANLSTVALTYALKYSVGRTRPNARNHHSYPSGHTSVAFATATMYQMWYGWKAGLPAYAMAALTAFQRMDDDQHWFSDVMMGAAIGIALPYMLYQGEERAESRATSMYIPLSVSIPFNFPTGK